MAIADAIAGLCRLILMSRAMACTLLNLLEQLLDEGSHRNGDPEPTLAARAQRVYEAVNGSGREMARDPARQHVLGFA